MDLSNLMGLNPGMSRNDPVELIKEERIDERPLESLNTNDTPDNKTQEIYDDETSTRKSKSMSELFKKCPTPKASKMLKLKIDLNAPTYDAQGELENDSDDDDIDDHFMGIFNAQILEDENLDKEKYTGSMTSEEDEENK